MYLHHNFNISVVANMFFFCVCVSLKILVDDTASLSLSTLRGLISKETVVLRHWGVETNVWFINRVDN